MATINGDSGDNTLSDTADGDQVNGLDGNDTITITHRSSADGGNGIDGISVDLSATTLAVNWNLLLNTYAGPQNFTNFEYFVTLKTGSGNDTIVTGPNSVGGATIDTGAGNDTISTQGGYTIYGGADTDTLIFDYRNDGRSAYVYNSSFAPASDGGAGYDATYYSNTVTTFYSIERFVIYGTNNGDFWLTGAGDDVFYGGSGNDSVTLGAGANTADGGAGVNKISADLSAATTAITWNLLTNSYSGPGSYTNFQYFGAVNSDAYRLPTSSQGGVFTGSGDDIITGGSGTSSAMQIVNTGGGNDTFKASAGVYSYAGGSGSDTLILDYSAAIAPVTTGQSAGATTNVAPTVDAGGGYDGTYRFNTAGGVTLARVVFTSVEQFDLTTGSGNDFITTGDGNDVVRTGLGNDSITALGGNDTIYPGVGTDIVNGGAGTDRLVFDYSGATNAVTTLSGPTANVGAGGFDGHYGDGTAAFDVTYTSIEAFTITTGSGNDVIVTASGDDIVDGGAGADTMTGGAGNDIYYVDDVGDVVVENTGEGTDEVRTALASYTLAANVETLTGTGTAQTLTGNGLNNTITGTVGNDIIDGGTGADTMIGGSGNDVYYVDNAGDVVTEAGGSGGGTDEVRTTLASYSLAANVENLVGLLTTGQALTGNALANTITGGSGNDTLDGGGGSDTLIGGAGDDTYVMNGAGLTITELAGGGTDTIATSLASYTLDTPNVENLTGTATTGQTLTGDGNVNTITGSIGNDTLDGGGGADTLVGGLGDDTYRVNDLGVTVTEAPNGGTDTVVTSLDSYTLGANLENLTGFGGNGQVLTGNALANVITGNDGNDTLDGGGGADTLMGGVGNDTYIVNAAGATIVETLNNGTDTVQTTLAAYSLGANLENLTFTGTGTFAGTGNELDNTLDASATGAGATLTGGGGDDRLIGGAGNDTLDGGTGADTMIGGLGNDIYFVDSVGDVVTEAANGGTDEIRTALASYTLASANVENLTGTATTGQTLTGDANANTITGGTGNDTLDGGGGTDRLVGGLGDDIYIVDSLDDVVVESAGQGFDTVRTSIANYVLPANVEQLIYTGTGTANFSGNAGDNMLTGNTGNDYFDASQGGNDTLSGGGGNDAFYFGAAFTGDDRVEGGTGTNDQIGLRGDYTGANRIVLQAGTITGVEVIAALGNFSYDITTVDANLAAGQILTIYGTEIGAANALTFDGSAEIDGAFRIYGSLGTDTIKTGGGDDGIYFGSGRFNPGVDHVDAGGGTNDQMALDGTYTGLTITRGDIVNVETLVLLDGQAARADYSITLADDWTTGSEVHGVYAVAVRNGVTVDAHLETTSQLKFWGGQGADTLTGGADTTGGSNWFDGGAGGDTMTGGAGIDTYFYGTAANSMGLNYDRIVNFDQAHDKITLPFTVADIDAAKTGALSTGSFESDLTAALGTLGGHHAVQFTASSGSLMNQIFEVIDVNGVAGYQAGQDMVIELVTPTNGAITTTTPFL